MASWEEQGRVSVFTGSELMLLETMAGMDSDKINPVHYYLWIPDEKSETISKSILNIN